MEYPIEGWTKEDARELRDILAGPVMTKVTGELKSLSNQLVEVICRARASDMGAVADLSQAQGKREAIEEFLNSLTVLSTIPQNEEKK